MGRGKTCSSHVLPKPINPSSREMMGFGKTRKKERTLPLPILRNPMLPLSAMETGSIANDQPDKKQRNRNQRPNLPGVTCDPASIACDEYLLSVTENASAGRRREDGQSFWHSPLQCVERRIGDMKRCFGCRAFGPDAQGEIARKVEHRAACVVAGRRLHECNVGGFQIRADQRGADLETSAWNAILVQRLDRDFDLVAMPDHPGVEARVAHEYVAQDLRPHEWKLRHCLPVLVPCAGAMRGKRNHTAIAVAPGGEQRHLLVLGIGHREMKVGLCFA